MADPLRILPFRIEIPAKARHHPYVREVKACLKVIAGEKGESNGGVIGTENTRRPELYGWLNPVSPHMDNTDGDHWIFVLLLSGPCHVCAIDPVTSNVYRAPVRAGDMFCLNDRIPHWTEGRGASVGIFMGEFDTPKDSIGPAISLERGLRRLASGAWTAPRVRNGFRVVFPGMCLATPDFNRMHTVRRAVAERLKWEVIRCWECSADAVQLDSQWPYHWERNLCAGCL